MRKFIYTAMAVSFASIAHSQTNTFPSSGNVGIGTTSPQYPLDVFGSARITDTVFTSGVIITQQVASGSVNANSTTITGTATVGGSLGLGTLFPTSRLDVNGNARVNGTIFSTKITTSRIAPFTGDSIIHLFDSTIDISSFGRITNSNLSGAKGISIGHNTVGIGPDCFAVGEGVRSGSASVSNSIYFGSRPQNYNGFVLYNVPNSFGVGFNSDIPTFLVGSSNGAGTTGNVEIGHGIGKVIIGDAQATALNFGSGYIGFNAARNFNGTWTLGNDGANNGGAVIYSNVQGTLYFANASSTGSGNQSFTDNSIFSKVKMTINPNGNVGIGTTPSSTYKLVVEGTIGSREVMVTLSPWPDYVFTEDHKNKMLTLDEYDKYLVENKHLFNFPSAKDMEEAGGIELGKMQIKQTEKLEELYLYVIELNKSNEKLSKEIEELKEELKKVKK